MMKMNITAILLMIALMTIIGYILMTILINKNITNNLNKVYSALFMAIIMMMATIITTEKIEKNYEILIILGIFSAIGYKMIKEQIYINYRNYLLAMIEHHEMAIVMSEKILNKSNIPLEISELATNIIKLQTTEIEQMREYLAN